MFNLYNKKPNSIKDIALKNAPIYHHMATRMPQDSESGNQNLPYDNAPPSLAKSTTKRNSLLLK